MDRLKTYFYTAQNKQQQIISILTAWVGVGGPKAELTPFDGEATGGLIKGPIPG